MPAGCAHAVGGGAQRGTRGLPAADSAQPHTGNAAAGLSCCLGRQRCQLAVAAALNSRILATQPLD